MILSPKKNQFPIDKKIIVEFVTSSELEMIMNEFKCKKESKKRQNRTNSLRTLEREPSETFYVFMGLKYHYGM
jgi:hypothetical protein